MEGQVILSQIPLDQLTKQLVDALKIEIQSQAEKDLQEKLLSPDEARNLFSPAISKPTLESYVRQGCFPKYHLGGRTWFKYGEIMSALKSLKRYKRS